jgi:UDP-N-acetylglucosamine--N-acetylmuramyl-(pentapeptide) pyrophosphoryl-undecaprenol N-acetylglucosamine transferase
MDLAYAASDLLISRAGASTISEICLVAKPAILVPSPNVAEDHQTKNAMALVARDAARIIKDSDALKDLIPSVLTLIKNDKLLDDLSQNISKLALRNSADRIADEVLKLMHSAK